MTTLSAFELAGKIALVSGASRGIGRSIATTLAAAGAEVILTSRKQEACEDVAQAIRAGGGKAQAMSCHIGDPTAIDTLLEGVRERYGRLDILVNNAATNPHFGPIWETDAAAFEKTVDVNIRGYFFMSAGAAKLMLSQGGGAIINIASVNGEVPGLMQGIYSITKAAVISMTKAFAKELGPHGVRVNALLPGATDTKFAAALLQNKAILAKALEHIPMGRVAEPDEMAGAVLFLASAAASYVTGACLPVDGGYLVA
jgi:NAD(P)-dependent dehydrogenase (short-subunit alcohol dehydrogenase family)